MHPETIWKVKKSDFNTLKIWEEDRKYVSTHMGKALVGMLDTIIQRMLTSSRENDQFVAYFKNYIQIQLSTADSIAKNATKHLLPQAKPYVKNAVEYGNFIKSIGKFDDFYAKNLKAFAGGLKSLVDKNLMTFTERLGKSVEKHQKDYEITLKEYSYNDASAERTFVELIQTFNLFDDYARGQRQVRPEGDLWLQETVFLKFAFESNTHLIKLRAMLQEVWTEAKELERERIKLIKQLYQDIVEHNMAIFGENKKNIDVMKELSGLNHLQVVDELYSFRAVVSQPELESMVKVRHFQKINFDFEEITEAKLHSFMDSVRIENSAPESKLILKKSLLKR